MRRDIAKIFVLSLFMLSPLFLLRSESTLSGTDLDRLQWLENLNATKALDWVHYENSRVESRLLDSAWMKKDEQVAVDIFKSNKTVITGKVIGQYVYSLRPSPTSPQGSWDRIGIEDYIAHKHTWEEVLNIDDYNLRTGKKYIFKKADCLAPESELCLLHFSDAGTDQVYVKEFNLRTKKFVESGFRSDKFIASFSWIDKNTIISNAKTWNGLIDSIFHPDTPTIWKRNEPASRSFEGLTPTQASLRRLTIDTSINHPLTIAYTSPSAGSTVQQGLIMGKSELKTFKLPSGYKVVGLVSNSLIAFKDPLHGSGYYGSLFAIDIASLEDKDPKIRMIFD
ncbi:MAG: S9 family peptidase, partial [Proteobacteria bacterium]